MAKKTPSTAAVADIMKKSTLDNLSSILKQEGLEKAKETWQSLNDIYSGEDWWPPVARAKRELFDAYAREQEELERQKELARIEAARQSATGIPNIIIGGNVTGAPQWAPVVGSAGQVIGVTEGDAIVEQQKS